MPIESLFITSFRNHKSKKIEFSEGLTVIWGENGSGKTSILEAVHLLSYGKSFKTHQQKNLIKDREDFAIAKGVFLGRYDKDVIAAQMNRKTRNTFKLNGKPVLSRKDLIGRNSVVVLSPEEQPITKGSPLERRQFFDKMFSVSNQDYINTLQKYNQVLKQRNAALLSVREGFMKEGDMSSWDDSFSSVAESLWLMRKKHLVSFKEIYYSFIDKYDKNLKIEVLYKKETPLKEEIQRDLLKTKKTDLFKGRTSIGPHKDDIKILWKKKDIRNFGSQGEHKLALVLLKISEMAFIKKKTSVFPILLLDDLFSKLDLERSKKIVSLLGDLKSEKGKPVQTIITTTDMLNIEKSGLLENQKNIKTYRLQR